MMMYQPVGYSGGMLIGKKIAHREAGRGEHLKSSLVLTTDLRNSSGPIPGNPQIWAPKEVVYELDNGEVAYDVNFSIAQVVPGLPFPLALPGFARVRVLDVSTSSQVDGFQATAKVEALDSGGMYQAGHVYIVSWDMLIWYDENYAFVLTSPPLLGFNLPYGVGPIAEVV